MSIFKTAESKELDAATKELKRATAKASDIGDRLSSVDQLIDRARANVQSKNEQLSQLAEGELSLNEVESRSRLIIEERMKEEAWLAQLVKNRTSLVADLGTAKAAAISGEKTVLQAQSLVAAATYQKALETFAASCEEPFRKLRSVAFRHFFYTHSKTLTEAGARQSAWMNLRGLWSQVEDLIDKSIEAEAESVATEIGTVDLIRAESVADDERVAANNKPDGGAAAIRDLITRKRAVPPPPPAPSLADMNGASQRCKESEDAISRFEERLSELRRMERDLKDDPMPAANLFNSDRSVKKAQVLTQIKETETKLAARRTLYTQQKAARDELIEKRAAQPTKAA